jgi:hypothetical protein
MIPFGSRENDLETTTDQSQSSGDRSPTSSPTDVKTDLDKIVDEVEDIPDENMSFTPLPGYDDGIEVAWSRDFSVVADAFGLSFSYPHWHNGKLYVTDRGDGKVYAGLPGEEEFENIISSSLSSPDGSSAYYPWHLNNDYIAMINGSQIEIYGPERTMLWRRSLDITIDELWNPPNSGKLHILPHKKIYDINSGEKVGEYDINVDMGLTFAQPSDDLFASKEDLAYGVGKDMTTFVFDRNGEVKWKANDIPKPGPEVRLGHTFIQYVRDGLVFSNCVIESNNNKYQRFTRGYDAETGNKVFELDKERSFQSPWLANIAYHSETGNVFWQSSRYKLNSGVYSVPEGVGFPFVWGDKLLIWINNHNLPSTLAHRVVCVDINSGVELWRYSPSKMVGHATITPYGIVVGHKGGEIKLLTPR